MFFHKESVGNLQPSTPSYITDLWDTHMFWPNLVTDPPLSNKTSFLNG